jgi:DsbC/DsbD-like thiol-disulfide interchange protein
VQKFALRLVLALMPALILSAQASPLRAEQASHWAQVLNGQARLVRGMMLPDGSIEAGVQIQLDEGWKTYWRVPGDAGVPPEFNWARSVNVSDVAVLWPAPVWLHDEFGVSIGYKKEVVFPIVVTQADWTKASTVNLTLHFAVCNDICAPVQADLSLKIPSQSIVPQFAGLIARYMSQVPKPVDEVDGLRVTDVRTEVADKDVFLLVDVEYEDMSQAMDIFVEGPEEFYFTTPRDEATGTDGQKRYRIRVDGAASVNALGDASMNFVLVQGDKRVAQSWRLQ